MKKIAEILMFLLLCGNAFAAEQAADSLPLQEGNLEASPNAPEEQSPAVSKFKERLSLRLLSNYNYIDLRHSKISPDGALKSKQPLNLGFGIGYDSLFTLFGVGWDVSFSFYFDIPGTQNDKDAEIFAFDFDFYPGSWYIDLRYISYEGAIKFNNQKYDVLIDDLRFSVLYMLTARDKFSLRSAYLLDRRQKYSAGSFVVGGRIQVNAFEHDPVPPVYLSSDWLNAGYTYTLQFRNSMFINLWVATGFGYGSIDLEGKDNYDETVYATELDTKFVFGYIGEKWAWNGIAKASNAYIFRNSSYEVLRIISLSTQLIRRF